MEENKKYTIPAAIILAGVLIAGALYFTNRPNPAPVNNNTQPQLGVPAVSADDHILGDPNAKVVIVDDNHWTPVTSKSSFSSNRELRIASLAISQGFL